MRLDVRMRKVEKKPYTTKCVPCETPAPLAEFFPDTKVLTSLISDANEFRLFISDKPFAPGEVDLALPPLPFIRSTKNLIRFEFLNSRGWRLRTSSEYPVTLALIYNDALDKEFIAERKPIHFGISAITDAAVEDEKRPEPADMGVVEGEAGSAAVEESEILEWFKAQLDLKGQRQLAREMGINPSIVNRNFKRLKNGEPLTKPFRQRIERILDALRQEKLRQQRQTDLSEAKAKAEAEAERARQEEAAREKAARDAAKRQESAKSARDAAGRHTKATAAHIKAVLQKRERERAVRPEMPRGSEQLASLKESSACNLKNSKNSRLGPDAQLRLESIKERATLPAAGSAIGRTLLKWGEILGGVALIALGVLLVIGYFLALVGSLVAIVIASVILGVIKVIELL